MLSTFPVFLIPVLSRLCTHNFRTKTVFEAEKEKQQMISEKNENWFVNFVSFLFYVLNFVPPECFPCNFLARRKLQEAIEN